MKNRLGFLAGIFLTTSFISSCTAHRSSFNCSSSANNVAIKQSVKWYRESAEQKALYRQVFSIATRYVQNWQKSHGANPWGVILDIDETVLNNSWYYQQCLDITMHEADFSRYISMAEKSTALPGAAEFTHFVHKLGGFVSLVSNRDGAYHDERGSVMESTNKNLKEQGIYFDQIILANDEQSKNPKDKNPRFNAVKTGHYDAENMVWSNTLPPHEVIAYIGDNIQDFPELHQKEMRALKENDDVFKRFSKGYFILPNPIYGSWAH